MYNTDFQPQIDASREHLLSGTGALSPRDLPTAVYYPPAGMKLVECQEDSNGELVPKTCLEKAIETQ